VPVLDRAWQLAMSAQRLKRAFRRSPRARVIPNVNKQ